MAIMVRQELAACSAMKRVSRASITAHSNPYCSGPDLHVSAKNLLLFGKLIGIVPLQGHCWDDSFSGNRFASIFTATCTGMLCINAVFSLLILVKNFYFEVPEYSTAPNVWIFYTSGAFSYFYFYFRGHGLNPLIVLLKRTRLSFTTYDASLARDINLLAAVTLASAILENIEIHLTFFPILDTQLTIHDAANASALQIYYLRSHHKLARIISYNPLLSIYLVICDKLCLYSRNFLVLLVVMFSRALSFQFKSLYHEARGALLIQRRNSEYSVNRALWHSLAKDHTTLYELFLQMEQFLSPIIFVVYGVNVYAVCTELYSVLMPTERTALADHIHSVWALLHVSFCIYMMSVVGAQVNIWAHKVAELYRKCPQSAYDLEVERSERFWASKTVGFTGAGCFILARPLYTSLLGVIFTFEIILLQNSNYEARAVDMGVRFKI